MKNSYLSFLAIILSTASIVLYFFEFSPIQIDPIGYFGLIAASIAVSVTLLIGYQIYRAFEIKKDIEFLRNKVNEINTIKGKLEEQGDRISAHLLYLAGTIATSSGKILHGISYFLGSLLRTLNVGEDSKWIQNTTIVMSMVGYSISKVTTSMLQADQKLSKPFNSAFVIIDETNLKIRAHKNYPAIQVKYEALMKAYFDLVEKSNQGSSK
ncbi:MAG: hypothetical protein CVU13_01090 [Bacteroidetes bacterium HGW-Bacteroidetes-8]|jgi:uncharacterized membrane-anchored protein YhcB (DUF1043 family)|nr:MAG: hypothetical protein CVU13_01090 [Bacteroidetes bacterium HGW-Bacteroidetes-8]